MFVVVMVGVTLAGSGPWSLSPGDVSVYVGTDVQRFGRLATAEGSFDEATVVTVDDGIVKLRGQASVSGGLVPGLELELTVPWEEVRANATDGAVCTSLGADTCRTTRGLGIVDLHVKGVVTDELRGAPLTVALGAEVREGAHTLATRDRITNIGEGTIDVGGFFAVGRSGALGNGYWTGYVAGLGRYRLPTDEGIPGAEMTGDVEWLAGGSMWLIGPTGTFLWRPDGVDFGAGDLADIDRFGALRVLNIRAGAKLLVRGSHRVSFSAAVLGTLYAENNPSDVLTLSAGLTWFAPAKGGA